MKAMYKRNMNMFADASWYAPACQSAQCKSAAAAHALILDTAVDAVSFLSLAVRISLLGLVRIILRKAQS